jgi:hypothetical protein
LLLGTGLVSGAGMLIRKRRILAYLLSRIPVTVSARAADFTGSRIMIRF